MNFAPIILVTMCMRIPVAVHSSPRALCDVASCWRYKKVHARFHWQSLSSIVFVESQNFLPFTVLWDAEVSDV